MGFVKVACHLFLWIRHKITLLVLANPPKSWKWPSAVFCPMHCQCIQAACPKAKEPYSHPIIFKQIFSFTFRRLRFGYWGLWSSARDPKSIAISLPSCSAPLSWSSKSNPFVRKLPSNLKTDHHGDSVAWYFKVYHYLLDVAASIVRTLCAAVSKFSYMNVPDCLNSWM